MVETALTRQMEKAMTKKKRIRTWVLIGLGVVILGAGGAFFLQQNAQQQALASEGGEEDKEGEEKKNSVPVELASVERRTMPNFFSATGTVEPTRSIELISKAQGEIVRLDVEEGDLVRAGQVILELDHREQELAAGKAEVLANTSKAEYERVQGIATRGLATDKELETAKQSAEVNEIDSALAKKALDDRIVRAPFDGMVTVRHVERGETVSEGAQLVDFAQVTPMELRLFLPESVVQEINLDQPVQIRSDITGEVLSGRVDRIAPVVDAATSTIKVTVHVEDSQGRLRAGSFVRARITTAVHDDALSIPKRALLPEAGANYVFVAEADSVRKVEVHTGYADDDFIEVREGLEGHEQVVTVGQGGLRTGSKIRDLNAPEPEEIDEEVPSNDEESTEQVEA